MDALFERMARGGHVQAPGDFETWTRVVEAVPAERFANATAHALTRVAPQEYAAHFQLGTSDPKPLDRIGQAQWAELGEALIGALSAEGVSDREILDWTGLATINPHEMSPTDLVALAVWMHQQHLGTLARAATTVRGQPDLVTNLLGPEALLALGEILGPLPMPPPTAEDFEAARTATGPRLSVASEPDEGTLPGAGTRGSAPAPGAPQARVGGPEGAPAEAETPPATTDIGALTPPPSPIPTEPEWLTPAHPVGDWPTWAQAEPHFRSGWERREGIQGQVWEDVAPAYQFAYARYRSSEYVGKSFADVELALRRDWDSHGSSASWDQVRPYVQELWQTVRRQQ